MFEDIIGNEEVKLLLDNSIKKNTTSHSYLFLGVQGIGKKMIAKEFAKMLLCLENEVSCISCKSCVEFDTNNNPDFLYIEPEVNTIKIEQIRYLQKKIQEKPIISNKKIYIINDADNMTREAQNCLLKTLEEPPEFATIILIGSNESSFLTTIKSRCMILKFNPIKDELIKKYLRENYDVQNINDNQIGMFQGSIKYAIALKDKQEEYAKIENLIYSLDKSDIIEVLNNAEILYKLKDGIDDILTYINIILLNKSKNEYKYTGCIEIVENTKERLSKNGNYDMCIDNMVFNMWEEVN